MKRSFAILVLLSLFRFRFCRAARNHARDEWAEFRQPQRPVSSPTNRPPVLGGVKSAGNQTGTINNSKKRPEEVDAGDVIKVDTTLVTLPVSVTDRNGRYVPNLTNQDVRLWEDGVEKQASVLTSLITVFRRPCAGHSGSRASRSKNSGRSNYLLPSCAGTDVMINIFDDDIGCCRNSRMTVTHADATGTRHRKWHAAVRRSRSRYQSATQSGGWTEAVVLFTDCVDTASRPRVLEPAMFEMLKKLDALIYPVQYDTLVMWAAGGGGGVGPAVSARLIQSIS